MADPANQTTANRPSAMYALRCISVWLTITGLALLALVLIIVLLSRFRPNHNALAISEQAKVDQIEIALQPLAELDFQSRAEIVRLRNEVVGRYPELVVGTYRPANAVFGQIVDGLPWWGTLGLAHYGRGEQSIEGPSEQSRSILNPFLLAVPEFYLQWDASIVAKAQAQGPEYPLYCHPYRLRWFPADAWAEVTYSAACLEWNHATVFSLLAYNARDWNLNYVFVSYPDSHNIAKFDPPAAAYHNPQSLHRGDNCGYPGGNDISPTTPPIDIIQIAAWPAQITIWFWRDDPGEAVASPDIVYVIHLQ
ncbi:MAG: hypothetical protein JXM73_21260 [Anaerolineae bacterium]|nr:hypothetical protein [Anaerolineae bacterium]